MRYKDRRDFIYDSEVFKRADVQTALKIHKEYVEKHGPQPAPTWFEIDRDPDKYDILWHMPLDSRAPISRQFSMACIVNFERTRWVPSAVGLVPKRKTSFIVDNTLLKEFDYFPMRGDMVFFDGYRYIILNVVLEPNGYWLQTNVWLGLLCECQIAVDGDARPLLDPSQAAPSELHNPTPIARHA